VFKEHAHDISVAANARTMQRGVASLFASIHVRAFPQEELDYLGASILRRHMQRRIPVPVPSVDIRWTAKGAALEQSLDAGSVTFARGIM